ncbi:Os08g0126350, partial [Oryza sativa Japonica Group]
MMLKLAALPPLQSLLDGPSTVFWVAENNDGMNSCHQTLDNTKVKNTLARGARQFVVQLAFETISISEVYLSSLTPQTNIGASLLGAEMTTFLAPPLSSSLLLVSEDTGGLHDILSTSLSPRNLVRVP